MVSNARNLSVERASVICDWLGKPAADTGIHMADEDDGWEFRTYRGIADEARRVADVLRASGMRRSDGACLILPTSHLCIASIYAVWLCGGTLTLIAPPTFGDGKEYVDHVSAVIASLGAAVVATSRDQKDVVDRAMAKAGISRRPVVLDEESANEAVPVDHSTDPAKFAMVQFTSGSTGPPRGIRISWQNLNANIAHINSAIAWRDGDAITSWLPLYHDMGLIGSFLTTVANQGNLYLMRPDQFIRDPVRWIRAMQHAQHTACPSFGLAYTTRRVKPDEVSDLDLSGWRSLVIGAEPIDVAQLRAFSQLLATTGFTPAAYRPAYGLAEATLMVSTTASGRPVSALRIDSSTLRLDKPVTVLEEQDFGDRPFAGAGWMVGLGEPPPGSTVRIVDASGVELPDGVLGEVVVTGNSVAAGYQGDSAPLDSSGTTRFIGGELYSGDAGFRRGGQLYVLGRMGSALKVRGKSVFMEDVESRIAHETGIAKNRICAVAMVSAGSQGIAVFVEDSSADCIPSIRRVLRADLGPAHSVRIATGRRGLIRRTTSGKPRRTHMWQLLESGKLGSNVVVHDSTTPADPLTAAPDARRGHAMILSDNVIAELLDRTLEVVDVAEDATVLIEGSIAEGFGNEGSDVDFLVVNLGDEEAPTMPTVLFVDGRRIEVRSRSIAQLRSQLEYAAQVAATESTTPLIDKDLLNRCQRFLRASIVRAGSARARVEALRDVLSYPTFTELMRRWWTARAEQSLRQAVAMAALGATPDALGWARDGLQQAAKAWAAANSEGYLETKWLAMQLDRIGPHELVGRYLLLEGELARAENTESGCGGLLDEVVDLAASLGVPSVVNDPHQVRLARVPGVTTWPIGARLHVVRDDRDVFALSEDGARAWRSVVFGRSLGEVRRRTSPAIGPHLAEFVRLGFVGLRWSGGGPIQPAIAMCDAVRPYTCPPTAGVPSLGVTGANRDERRTATLSPLSARRFVECAMNLIWSNVVVENAREDLVGAIKNAQGRVADIAARRLIGASVRMLLSASGVVPLPADVAAISTVQRILPDQFESRERLLERLQQAHRIRFAREDGQGDDGPTALAVLDDMVDTFRTIAGVDFPASFDSREQWRRTLALSYDWLRLGAYLDADLPIDEARDLLTSGGVQPHLRERKGSA